MECIVIGLIIGCIIGVLSGIGQLKRQAEDEEIRRLTLKQLRDKENRK